MWLLHASTLVLHQFSDADTPPYAILSHTWDSEEASFDDIRTLRQEDYHDELPKLRKITGCCSKARSDGFDYVWIDTCCIDKRSSAELSEAINSMFRWYHDAVVCYVYLSDVPGEQDPFLNGSDFSDSRWFTRGWTLQELIAPATVEFLAMDWTEIGTKLSLQFKIEALTGIKRQILCGTKPVDSVCVAQRMSWASRRRTTRLEDMAYSLMGLFGVHMPMLYGESVKAFERLQLEIIKNSNDQSIFAWEGRGLDSMISRAGAMRGLLAYTPSEFSKCWNVCLHDPTINKPFSMTNGGLFIGLPLVPMEDHTVDFTNWGSCYYGILNCSYEGELGSSTNQSLAIQLRRSSESTYYRCHNMMFPRSITKIPAVRSPSVSIYVPRTEPDISNQTTRGRDVYVIIKDPLWNKTGFSVVEKLPATPFWHTTEQFSHYTLGVVFWRLGFMGLLFQNSNGERFIAGVAIEEKLPRCVIITDLDKESIDSLKNWMESFWNRNLLPADLKYWSQKLGPPLDRITKHLPSGRAVYMAAKKKVEMAKKSAVYDVTIKISETEMQGKH